MYGNRLKELRLLKGYTMEEVGEKIGIKKSSYASYESKYRNPPLDKLINLSKLYNVSVDYILGLTPVRHPIKHCIGSQLHEVYERRGLHWDGLEIPEEVLVVLEHKLDEITKEVTRSTEYQQEG